MSDNLREYFLNPFADVGKGGSIFEHSYKYLIAFDLFIY